MAPTAEPLPQQPVPLPAAAPPPPPASPMHRARTLLAQARESLSLRKQKKLDKILTAIDAKGRLTNDEVEKLLHVSDATATRYLAALEREGKIKQVGKTGQAVYYARA